MSFKQLRTLTRKSQILFGPFKECTVDYIIKMHHIHYLRRTYYAASMVSFTDDVLDDLGITEEWRIEKPGSDKEMEKEFNTFIDDPRRRHGISNKARYRKAVHRKFHNVDYKGVLQAKNLRTY